MKDNIFIRAENFEKALQYKSDNPDLQIFSGGTDLMVRINQSVHDGLLLLYIGDCGLQDIRVEGTTLCIGAAATHTSIAHSDLVKSYAPLLAKACSEIGSLAVRNAGTIAGNIINASPSADAATALLALDAEIKLRTASGCRQVPIDEFFIGLKKTDIHKDEIIEQVCIPIDKYNRYSWKKIGRRTSEVISVVSMGVALKIENGFCYEARVSVGSVAPHPLFALKTSEYLSGRKLDSETIMQAAESIYCEIAPIDDVRATAAYRKSVSRNMLKSILADLAIE